MTEIFVQFSSASEETIVASFGAPQDETAFPNQGVVNSSDPRWGTYYKTIPAGAQSAWPAPTSN